MLGFKAPANNDMQGFVELQGGLTSSQSQLWEVDMRADNMGKLGDYIPWMPFAVVRNYQFTTTSVAEHTFKLRCKAGTSDRWIYYRLNGGDITIMEIQVNMSSSKIFLGNQEFASESTNVVSIHSATKFPSGIYTSSSRV